MQFFAKNVTFHRFGKVLVKMFGAFSFKVLRCNKLGTSNKQTKCLNHQTTWKNRRSGKTKAEENLGFPDSASALGQPPAVGKLPLPGLLWGKLSGSPSVPVSQLVPSHNVSKFSRTL